MNLQTPRQMGGVSGDVKSPSMHGMKGSMTPVSRGPGTPVMAPGRTDPAGAREEVGFCFFLRCVFTLFFFLNADIPGFRCLSC